MHSIRIVGAGSIGNHLAHAARTRGWLVTLTDIDRAALERAATTFTRRATASGILPSSSRIRARRRKTRPT